MATLSSPPDKTTFEFLHKYMAALLEDASLIESKNLQLHVKKRIGYMGTQVVLDWKDIAHRIHEDKTTAYWYYDAPKTWFQMWKQDKAPKWFRIRYPVQCKQKKFKRTVRFTRYATYPLANIAIPKDSPLFIERLGGVERIEDKVEAL